MPSGCPARDGTPPLGDAKFPAMRIAFALICLVVFGTMAGAGLRAVGGARQMSTRQLQELDTAIDRIVAEHKERRDAAPATTSTSAFEERENKSAVEERENKPAVAMAGGTEGKPAARPESKMAAVSQSKNQRPRPGRTASRHNTLIPQAFISLQKFATMAFGLR
jgi:hypothetical protein